MSAPVKTCSCGIRVESEDAWDALPTPTKGGEMHVCELQEVWSFRNCACGSTLTRTHCSACGGEVLPDAEHVCDDDTDAQIATLITAFVLGRGGAFDRMLARVGEESVSP